MTERNWIALVALSLGCGAEPPPEKVPPPPPPPALADVVATWTSGESHVRALDGAELVAWKLERCAPLGADLPDALTTLVGARAWALPCEGAGPLSPLVAALGWEAESPAGEVWLACDALRGWIAHGIDRCGEALTLPSGERLPIESQGELLAAALDLADFGGEDFGPEAAAQTWFQAGAAELGPGELALLAGIFEAPYLASSPRSWRALRGQGLTHGVALGLWGVEEVGRLSGEAIPPRQVPRPPISRLPSFLSGVRDELWALPLPAVERRRGVEVLTGFDVELAKVAAASKKAILKLWTKNRKKEAGELAKALEEYGGTLEELPTELAPPGSRLDVPEEEPLISMFLVEPVTGRVRLLVDDAVPGKIKEDGAMWRRRQPGSSFKTFLYAAAVEQGLVQTDRFIDKRFAYEVKKSEPIWTPRNHQDEYLGELTARRALSHSLNSVAIQVIFKIGPRRLAGMAGRLGITTPIHAVPALALGTSPVTLSDMVCAFATLGSGGLRVRPRFVAAVASLEGHTLWAPTYALEQVVDPRVAFVTLDMLREVTLSGTAAAARKLPFQVAGKTGTTNESKDAWFMGLSSSLVGGVWVGFDNKDPLGGHETGGSLALPLWIEVMKKAGERQKPADFQPPPGVVIEPRNLFSGRPSEKGRPTAFIEPPRKGCLQAAPEGALPMEGDEVGTPTPRPPRKKKPDPGCTWRPVEWPPRPSPTDGEEPAPTPVPG